MDGALRAIGAANAKDGVPNAVGMNGLLQPGFRGRQIVGMDGVAPALVHQSRLLLLRRHAIPATQAAVPLQLVGVQVPIPDTDIGDVIGQLLAFTDACLAFFRGPALGDVLDHAEMTKRLPWRDADRGDGHVDPDHRAVGLEIALVHLETRDFPGIQPSHVVQILLHVIRVGDGHPVDGGHVFAGPTGNGGEAAIDLVDVPCVRVDQGNPQWGILEYGAKPRIRLLSLRECGLCMALSQGENHPHRTEHQQGQELVDVASPKAVGRLHEEVVRQQHRDRGRDQARRTTAEPATGEYGGVEEEPVEGLHHIPQQRLEGPGEEGKE